MTTVKLESPEDRYIRVVLEAFTKFVQVSSLAVGLSLSEEEARKRVQQMIEEERETLEAACT